MRTITINAIDKHSSNTMSTSIRVDGIDKEAIDLAKEEFFESVSKNFDKWYYEVETFDDLTLDELSMLSDLELELN
jgi:hypothetical protein